MYLILILSFFKKKHVQDLGDNGHNKQNIILYIIVRVRAKTCVSCVAIDHILGKNNLILISNENQRSHKTKKSVKIVYCFILFLSSLSCFYRCSFKLSETTHMTKAKFKMLSAE